jgi:creatinine amidohydrolase
MNEADPVQADVREEIMKETVLMSELTWVEYERRLKEEDAIVMLPAGATEQHGPHLPLGCDAMLASEVARRAAERVGGIVAPAVSYGYKSQPRTGGGNHFCGTTSLDGHTLSSVVRDIIKEFGRHGAKKIAVIDGHYENNLFLTEGIELALRDLRHDGLRDIRVVKMVYCEEIKPATLDRIFPNGYPGLALEHAATLETSMMLYLFPELVRADWIPDHPAPSFPPYDVYPTNTDWVPPNGVLSPAGAATAEFGKLLIDEFVDLVATVLQKEFRSTTGEPSRATAAGVR